MRRRLHHVDMLAAAALTALDALRHAIVLLDQDGRVLHTNAAGDALLAKGDGLGVMRGTLQAATPSFTTRLQAALAGAAGGNGTPVRAAALRLPRPGDRRPLTVLVMPFRTEAHWSLARQPAVLLCVTDPDAGSVPSGRRLAEMFGLTGAEAALAADLLAGGELREIAERRGRSITTIRTQLARLMAKTDVNRQSELLRMLGNLPRLSEPN